MIFHQITNSYGNYHYNAYIYNKTFTGVHFHGNYELIYSIEGQAEISVSGTKYYLAPGEMILVAPYTIHCIEEVENSKIWVGVFSQDYISAFEENNRFVSFVKFTCDRQVEKLLKENLFVENKPERYMLKACLYLVCNQCKTTAVSHNSKQDNSFMHAVIDYISHNLSQDISLKDMASELNYEYHYFSSLFNKCFHMNFKGFVNIFRFETACRLLSDKKETVTSVCNKCGFGSIRNFDRVFKQLSGMTPSAYGKSLK